TLLIRPSGSDQVGLEDPAGTGTAAVEVRESVQSRGDDADAVDRDDIGVSPPGNVIAPAVGPLFSADATTIVPRAHRYSLRDRRFHFVAPEARTTVRASRQSAKGSDTRPPKRPKSTARGCVTRPRSGSSRPTGTVSQFPADCFSFHLE